jgi:type I restriction enzyme S subunit
VRETWDSRPLGAFSDIKYGYTAKADSEPVGPRFLRITDIQNGAVNWDQVPFCKVSEKDHAKHKVKEGDIVFARTGATTGKSFLIREAPDTVCASYLIKVRPNRTTVLPEFLNIYFQTSEYWDAIALGTEGAAQGGFNASKLGALPIPLPPTEEQQRIVTVLDEAFEHLTRARAHAEANLQNARDLFESAIEAALERAGGEPVTLQEMMDTGMITGHLDGNHGSDYPRKAEFVSEGVPYISANCIADNEIDFGRCKYLTPERASGLRKGVAENRDVLFAHNATVGPVTLLKTEEEKVILSTSLTYYRCNEEELIPEFLVCEMRSAGFRRQYEAVMAQATRNQVPITMQRTFTHLIPPLAEQRRIAELGVELEASCNSAVKAYEASLKDLDDLRQSLLQKAFAGELT